MNSFSYGLFHFRYLFHGWYQRIAKKAPLFLTFIVTSRCNARCRHCYYIERFEKTKGKGELTLEEIRRISLSMPSFPKMFVTGGEPFMRDDLAEILLTFSQNNNVRYITVPTNGILTEKVERGVTSFLEMDKKTLLQIQLSIDGIGEEHERNRGVKGSFDALIETHDILNRISKRYENLDISFCFVLHRDNQNSIEKVKDYLLNELGSNNLCLVMVRGSTFVKGLCDIDIEKYERAKNLLKSLEKKDRYNLFRRIYYTRKRLHHDVIMRNYQSRKPFIPCYAGILNVVIDEFGEVYPCEVLQMSMGNMRESNYNFKNVWSSEKAEKVRRWIRENRCICTQEGNFITNLSFTLKMYPSLLLEWFKIG